MIRPAHVVVLIASATACAAGGADPDRPATTISDDGTGSTGTSSADGADDDDAADDSMACIPGQQIACPCPGGGDGAQACNADGTGYEPCVCAGDTEPGDTSATTSDAVTTGGSTGDPGDCAPAVDCLSCVTCSVDNTCADEYDACITVETCQAAADCVTQCGFSQECAVKCEPVNDMEASELYAKLGECLIAACPQCLNE